MATTTARVSAKLGVSEYGSHQPRFEVSFPRGTSHRVLAAKLYEVAAIVEARSEGESWAVNVVKGETTGAIVIELADGTIEEARRATDILRDLV